MFYLHKITLETATANPVGGFIWQSSTRVEDKHLLNMNVGTFSYQTCKTQYFINSAAFYKEAKEAMQKEILNGLPDYVAEMPLCPLEQMVETPCFESIDDLPPFN